MKGRDWYNLSKEEAFQRADSSPQGLSPKESRKRLERDGPNELQEIYRISPWRILATQFAHPLVIILIAAAIIAGLLGQVLDSLVIVLIVVFNAIFGFVQEFRAEKAIEALKALTAPKAQVLRDGEVKSVPTRELVVGDVVDLGAGRKVPADLRLFEVANLKVNEASLTGESVPVSKGVHPLSGEVFLGDRTNMCLTGTVVDTGRGKGVVVATGMATELGKIAGLVQEEPKSQTPLQRQLGHFARQLGVAILLIAAFIFIAGYLREPDMLLLFLTAVSLAVAAIPEALPAVVTIALALGLRRMARRNALIRRLPAVEALGSAAVICTDKTGTLTTGQMNVRVVSTGRVGYEVIGEGFDPQGVYRLGGKSVDPKADEHLLLLLRCGMLCNDARLVMKGERWTVAGDVTEGALLVAGMRSGLRREDVEGQMPRVAEIAFTSERKLMTTIHASVDENTLAELRAGGDGAEALLLREVKGKVACVKGAPEPVVARCSARHVDGSAVPITDADREVILVEAQSLASKAYRVLALARRTLPDDLQALDEESVETDLTFLGLVGMMDAPRRDAIEAVDRCREAGINVVMITGDHLLTATAVAEEMDILEAGDRTMTGDELERLSAEELAEQVEQVKLYARVSPEHKVKVVDAWKQRGYIVAMTGDGVNDAPALKRSDVGIAMGITGTDVAKESADMVLTDDNFASIVATVEEGRGVYENIRKFVRYLLSTNSGEVLVLFVASVLFLPLPLLPLQILWINLITDGFPALALGVEPKERGLMKRPPRNPQAGILSGGIAFHILWVGTLMTVGSLGLYVWALSQGDIRNARTLTFYTVAMFQVFHVLAIRVSRESVFTAGFFRNPYLIGAVILTVVLQLAVVYLPFLQIPFQTLGLPLNELLVATGVASTVFFAVELEKWLRRGRGERLFIASQQSIRE